MSAGSSGYQGGLEPSTAGADVNAWAFIVQSLTGRYNTATLVEVLACTNDGTTDIVGFVDIKLLVNQIDGLGNSVPNAEVYGVPYLRIQGGSDAIICDPKPGDQGMAMFADHDISSVKATRHGNTNPGTRRRFDLADAMYLGGWVNTLPIQYLRFHEDGIYVNTPNNLTVTVGKNLTATVGGNMSATVSGTTLVDSGGEMTLRAPHIVMDTPLTSFTGVVSIDNSQGIVGNAATFHGPVELTTGDLTVDTGSIHALAADVTAQTVSLHAHLHSGVTPGGGNTGQPVP